MKSVNKEQKNNKNIPDRSNYDLLRSKLVLSLMFFLFLSIIFIFYILQNNTPESDISKNIAKNPFLSKRIFSEQQNDILINFVLLKRTLKDFVVRTDNKVGVYFEYLPSGVSIGVNDTEEIRLASLSKVPLVMSILKKHERGELSLNDMVTIKKENLDKNFGSLWQKGEGTVISIKDLIEICLKESDNTAYEVLFNQLSRQDIIDVYDSLDIQVQDTETLHPLVSPKSYASIFRSLYLSSYLQNEDSNYILDILTKTIFQDKIPAGIPSAVKVAHKIGVFDVDLKSNGQTEDVYSDCGIVYVPQRPYILCVFSQTSDEEAKNNISYISKMVYDYVILVNGAN